MPGKVVPVLPNGYQKVGPRDFADHGVSNGSHQRVAVESSTLIARFEETDVFASDQGRERNADSDSLAEREEVRPKRRMLETEHPTGAAEAGLDFIHNQQHARVASQLAQLLEEAN